MAESYALPGLYTPALSKFIIPKHYALLFEMETGVDKVAGVSTVTVDILKGVDNTIAVHALGLTIKSTHLQAASEKLVSEETSYDDHYETVTFKFNKTLPVGPATLVINFEAPVNQTKTSGVYSMKYLDAEGKTKRGFATDFEPCYARTAYPCFDEPALRCTFNISVIVPEPLLAISNMDESSSSPVGPEDHVGFFQGISKEAKKKVTFETSPPMSPYLFTFIVGMYDALEESTTLPYNSKNEKEPTVVRLRMFTPPGETEKGRYMMDLSIKTLHFYCSKLECGYPLPKLDIVGVKDFGSLGMENFGCMSFHQDYFLVDESTSPRIVKRIARLVGHEVGHSWFGDLVSIRWWNYLWLKEGFVRYMEFYLVEEHCPKEWKHWRNFMLTVFGRALSADESKTTHPVQQDVPQARDVHSIFDIITYGKGASCLRMLIEYIGSDTLWKAMRAYVNKYQWKSVALEDLWSIISETCGEDVSSMMDNWINKPGHPSLSYDISEVKPGQNTYTITQSVAGKLDSDTLWCIPLVYKVGENIHKVLLDKKVNTLVVEHNPGDMVKFNWKHVGFFRSEYAPEIMDQYTKAIVKGQMPEEDALGILMDAAYFNDKKLLLPLARCFKDSTDEYYWNAMIPILEEADSLFSVADLEALTTPIMDHMGWFDCKKASLKIAQSRILKALISCGSTKLLGEATKCVVNAIEKGELKVFFDNQLDSVITAYGSVEHKTYMIKYREEKFSLASLWSSK